MAKIFKEKMAGMLKKIRLKPVTVAGKCRLQFGGAVILIISLALMIPHYWMGKLTDNAGIDLGRTILYLVKSDKFELDKTMGKGVLRLKREEGSNIKDLPVRWIEIKKDDPQSLDGLSFQEKWIVKEILNDDLVDDYFWISSGKNGISYSNYITVVRAKDISSDSQYIENIASGFSANEPVGVLITQTPALQISRTKLFNNLAIIVAGLVAGVGALVAFYIIAQRIILSPIRQLRAMVNNVSEGNLDARSTIKTQDEYQRLADAFNLMLDGLQASQEKLRKANTQLDTKIAELSDRNIELYKANKLQSEFLANISHEFRTPLNAILGFAEILKSKADNDKNIRYADNIITSGRNLLTMINDLLELAKLEAGRMELRHESTSIPELCNGLVSFFAPLVETKNLHMEFVPKDEIPLVYTDPMKVQQILFNFISNAIKFTPEEGSIKISAGMADSKTIRIEVADTGQGIAEKDHEKIFEKFRQTDSSITRKVSGTGLGLAISKELAMLLTGNIGVISQEGQGSTFWLEIPLMEKPEEKPAE